MPRGRKASIQPVKPRKRRVRKAIKRRQPLTLQDRAKAAKQATAEAAQSVGAQMDDSLVAFEKVIKDHPLPTLGAALAMGIILGLMVGR